ncbi:MAG: phosphotransferase [Chitinispirillaceae bacterium]|nr:phosphotransferase [Chitinispirillaceae bacterium]
MNSQLVLTPAQQSFLKKNIDGFKNGRWKVSIAGQAGSQRQFVRVQEMSGRGDSYILVVWDSRDEDWRRYLSIPREVGAQVDFLPRIFCADGRRGLILEQDLGDETLKKFCDRNAAGHGTVLDAYRSVIGALVKWHSLDMALSPTIASRALDAETFLWETDYFARRFVVDFCGEERLLTGAWEKERRDLAQNAAALPKRPLHRDFQSENILFAQGAIKFVDYQGARLGPPAYDCASLLYDPYMNEYSQDEVDLLFGYYCSQALDVSMERRPFAICAAQRLMQALGAYGNLSLHQGKPRYREFVPRALERLCTVMERLQEFPAMLSVAQACRDAVRATNGDRRKKGGIHDSRQDQSEEPGP